MVRKIKEQVIDYSKVTSYETITEGTLGAVHILRQLKSGAPGPPLVSNGQLLAYPEKRETLCIIMWVHLCVSSNCASVRNNVDMSHV